MCRMLRVILKVEYRFLFSQWPPQHLMFCYCTVSITVNTLHMSLSMCLGNLTKIDTKIEINDACSFWEMELL